MMSNYIEPVERSPAWYEPDPLPKPDCICDGCKGEFYGDEDMYRFDGRILCGECLREEISMLPLRELANILDADRRTAAEIRYC